jgi:hypothetical protein
MDLQDLSSRQVAGAAAGNLTVTGIKLDDRLVLVQDLTNGNSDITTEFSITADDTINNTGGTSTNAHSVLVTWERHNRGRVKFDGSPRLGRYREPGPLAGKKD